MADYTDTLTMTLPLALADIAAKVGRAMDPDVGGAESFTREVLSTDGETVTYGDTIRCETRCTAEFKAQALAMFADPAMLQAACAQDYAIRWPDFTPPTLEECQQLISQLTIS